MYAFREVMAAGIIFLLLAVILTYPLILNFNDHFPGWPGDSYQFLWDQWWFFESIFHLHQNPFHCDVLYHPIGVNLTCHTLLPLKAFIGACLMPAVGMVTAFNTVLILSFIWAGLGMFLLCRFLKLENLPSLLAGIFFSFSPLRMMWALGHMNLFSMEWIPWVIWTWLATVESNSIRMAACFGICLAASGYSDPNVLIQTLVPWILIFAAGMKRGRTSRSMLLAGTGLSVFLVVISPYLWSSYQLISQEGFHCLDIPASIPSPDLVNFLIPNIMHPMIPPGVLLELSDSIGLHHLTIHPLGWTGCILIACGTVLSLKTRGFRVWVAVLTLGIGLTAGYEIRFLGRVLSESSWLPFRLMHRLPVLKLAREPSRFSSIVYFAGAVLLALFLSRAVNRKYLWIPVIAGMIIFEFLFLPFPLLPFPRSDVLSSLDNSSCRDRAVLIVPLWSRDAITTLHQVIHGYRITGGMISRSPRSIERFLDGQPVLRYIVSLQDPGIPLRFAGQVRFVIIKIDPVSAVIRVRQLPQGACMNLHLNGARWPDRQFQVSDVIVLDGYATIEPRRMSIYPHNGTCIRTEGEDPAARRSVRIPENLSWEDCAGLDPEPLKIPSWLTPELVRETMANLNIEMIQMLPCYRNSRLEEFFIKTLDIKLAGTDREILIYRF